MKTSKRTEEKVDALKEDVTTIKTALEDVPKVLSNTDSIKTDTGKLVEDSAALRRRVDELPTTPVVTDLIGKAMRDLMKDQDEKRAKQTWEMKPHQETVAARMAMNLVEQSNANLNVRGLPILRTGAQSINSAIQVSKSLLQKQAKALDSADAKCKKFKATKPEEKNKPEEEDKPDEFEQPDEVTRLLAYIGGGPELTGCVLWAVVNTLG